MSPRGRRILGWSLFWLGLGLFFSTRALLSTWLHRNTAPWSVLLLPWVLHWSTWGVLTPLMARLGRRFPVPPLAARPLLVHLIAAPLFTLVHFALSGALIGLIALVLPSLEMLASNLAVEFANQFHYGLLAYFLTVGYVVATGESDRARAHELRLSRLAEQLAQSELAALRMQIHPHFLFNSLHTTAELVHEDPELAERLLLGLAELLRRALRASERPLLPFAEELEFAEHYLSLEQARLEQRLRVRLDASEDALACLVPALLLQPLVENAVRHGIALRREPGEILVRARRHGERLEIEVENDLPQGPGAAAPGAGIGLANVRSRLENLHGADARVEAGRRGERFHVRLSLPWSTNPTCEEGSA